MVATSSLLSETGSEYLFPVDTVRRPELEEVYRAYGEVFAEFGVTEDFSSDKFSDNNVKGPERLEHRQEGGDKI